MSQTRTRCRKQRSNQAPVLAVLQGAEEPLTVPEIAETAHCAHITVRRHLKSLMDTGEVDRIGTRPRTSCDEKRQAGRGWYVYAPH